MWRRILAVLVARNREFYRDHAGLGWNIFMPILMVLAFAFIFSGEPQDQFKVGVVTAEGVLPQPATGFLALDHIQFIPLTDLEGAISKVDRHQLDLLVDMRPEPLAYWVNLESPKGYLAERLLLGADALTAAGAGPVRRTLSGAAVSYADWVLPGILAMNVMFSSLWGVGWVIVRYRKNGVLRRLKATPLSPFEFLTAQVLSRLLVVMSASLLVYGGAAMLLDFPMRGSYPALVADLCHRRPLPDQSGAYCFFTAAHRGAGRWDSQPDVLAHASAFRGLVLHGGHQQRRPVLLAALAADPPG